MTVDEYLDQGRYWHERYQTSDGCSLVGWFVHRIWPELESACWAHDYARHEIIELEDQETNDNLFKEALKQLGAPAWLRGPMYFFTRLHTFFGLPLGATISILIVLALIGAALIFG